MRVDLSQPPENLRSAAGEARWVEDIPDAVLGQLLRAQPWGQCVASLVAQLQTTPEHSVRVWARYLGMEARVGAELEALKPDFELLGFSECQQRVCLVARSSTDTEEGPLYLVTPDPLDLDRQAPVEALLERRAFSSPIRVLVLPDDFERCLARGEEGLRAMDSVRFDSTEEVAHDAVSALSLSMASIEATANPTVRLVDSTLYDALKIGASDIHFELQHKTLQIKYRLDGVLQQVRRVEGVDTASQVVSRIKVLADLDISERRIPQDGRFRVLLERREIDFRVSIMPNSTGEDAVLRILDRKHLMGQFETLTLDNLSFEDEVKAFIRRASRLPYGLLLVTGPTGSGKTTTLYAAITEVNTGLDKIVTIEDPIEYQLPNVLQIPVNEKKGLSFAKGLRSVLRHDPDKIMVGEIRDSETAQIAVQAALTGHQVFTTVHANNVFDVIGRFSNMGVDSFSLVAALTGIMAQRLVRMVCPHCAQSYEASQDDLLRMHGRIGESPVGPVVLKKAHGCHRCRGTGYRGRAAIAETLPIDDEMKDLLVQHAPITSLKRAAAGKGFTGLRESGIALARRGLTTLDEIDRVTPVQ